MSPEPEHTYQAPEVSPQQRVTATMNHYRDTLRAYNTAATPEQSLLAIEVAGAEAEILTVVEAELLCRAVRITGTTVWHKDSEEAGWHYQKRVFSSDVVIPTDIQLEGYDSGNSKIPCLYFEYKGFTHKAYLPALKWDLVEA